MVTVHSSQFQNSKKKKKKYQNHDIDCEVCEKNKRKLFFIENIKVEWQSKFNRFKIISKCWK